MMLLKFLAYFTLVLILAVLVAVLDIPMAITIILFYALACILAREE